MKKLKFYLLSAMAALAMFNAGAQSVDDIINKYVDAVGGKDVLGKVNSIYIVNDMQAMGNDAPDTVTIVNGKGYRNEAEFNGQKIIQCVNDKTGWSTNPMAGQSDPTPLPEDQYKNFRERLYIGGPLFNYAAKGYKAELQGQEKVGKANMYKIKLTSKDSVEITYYIDPSTYFIVQAVHHGNAMGQDVVITESYADFKKTDFGYTIPYTTNTDFGGQFQLSTTVKKVEINKQIDPKIFDMPAK